MNENNEINLKMTMGFIDPIVFKEKEIQIINNIISGSRLGKNIVFYKYGNLVFDENDKRHFNPKLNLHDSYKRSKINCIAYKNTCENCTFDYLYVYKTSNSESGFFGILAYNSNKNENIHLYGLNLDYTNLVVNLMRLSARKNT